MVSQCTEIPFSFHLPGLTNRSKKIVMSIDPFTGRNPSYCFVDLYRVEDAARALKTLQRRSIRGRPVKVNLEFKRRNRSARQASYMLVSGGTIARPFNENAYVFDRWPRDDASEHWTNPQDEGRRLYVGRLSKRSGQHTVDLEMRDLFDGFDLQAVSKIIPPHPSKRTESGDHHYCFVDLPTAQEAENAMRLLDGKKTAQGGTYKVQPSTERITRKVLREQFDGVSPGSLLVAPKRNLEGNRRRLERTQV